MTFKYKPLLDADFWKREAGRARKQEAGAAEAETAFKVFHEKRTREVDAMAKRDNALYSEDKNARRLKDLTPPERETLEAKVSARITEILSEKPPYGVYFEPKDGWHCTCDKCHKGRW